MPDKNWICMESLPPEKCMDLSSGMDYIQSEIRKYGVTRLSKKLAISRKCLYAIRNGSNPTIRVLFPIIKELEIETHFHYVANPEVPNAD